jgi:hypothetical protein
MSIDRVVTIPSPDGIALSCAPTEPSVFLAPFSATSRLQEILPTSIEEPKEESSDDDIDMRSRRGPTTHELEKDRFYVTSLSDDSSDEESEAVRVGQDAIDHALSSGPIASQQNGNFKVNGELINRLQAMESQKRMALERERAFARRHKDPQGEEHGTSHTTQKALMLWRKPYNFSLNFGQQAPTTTATSNSSTVSPTDPTVPNSAPNSAPEEVMEVDD